MDGKWSVSKRSGCSGKIYLVQEGGEEIGELFVDSLFFLSPSLSKVWTEALPPQSSLLGHIYIFFSYRRSHLFFRSIHVTFLHFFDLTSDSFVHSRVLCPTDQPTLPPPPPRVTLTRTGTSTTSQEGFTVISHTRGSRNRLRSARLPNSMEYRKQR